MDINLNTKLYSKNLSKKNSFKTDESNVKNHEKNYNNEIKINFKQIQYKIQKTKINKELS